MKVIVNTYLNVRVGAPSINAPCYQYLAPGTELLVEPTSFKGDKFEGSDEWLRDESGNYYWKGGVETEKSIISYNHWFDLLGIKAIWDTYGEKGESAKVLLLDSGINHKLSVFDGAININDSHNFIGDDKQIKDNIGHGTHCAGLIAARSSSYNVGIAPASTLLIAKVAEKDKPITLKKALKEYLETIPDKFDIVSISIALYKKDEELRKLISQYTEQGKIIIAAIGNDPFDINSRTSVYPGSFKDCIAVGSCEINNKLSSRTFIPDRVDIFAYGSHISSFENSEIPLPKSGTSQSTAIISGICALIISYLKRRNIKYNQESIRRLLRVYSDSLSNQPTYYLVKPQLIFEKLSQFKENEDLHHLIDDDLNDDHA